MFHGIFLLSISENTNELPWFYSHEITLCSQHNKKRAFKKVSIFHNTSCIVYYNQLFYKTIFMCSFLSYLFKVDVSSKHCFYEFQKKSLKKNLLTFSAIG